MGGSDVERRGETGREGSAGCRRHWGDKRKKQEITIAIVTISSLERQFITLAGVPFSHNSLKTRGGNQDQQGRLKRVDPLDRVR